MASTASTTSMASMTFSASFHQKTLLIVMVGSSLAPKWPIQVPFCGMGHQKSNFLLILALFLSEAVEASRCQFFENWWMKLKCPLLLKPLATIVQVNSQSFYPSEPFRISHFTMRHPVTVQTFVRKLIKAILPYCVEACKRCMYGQTKSLVHY